MFLELSPVTDIRRENFHIRIAGFAESQPNAPAIEVEGEVLNWKGLHSAVNRIGGSIRNTGCVRGDRIAILAENSLAYAAVFLGAVCAGMSVVTLPTMAGPEAIAAMIDDSKAKVLLASASSRDDADRSVRLAREGSVAVRIAFDFDAPGWIGIGAWSDAGSDEFVDPNITEKTEFNIVYSSGTTGRPKGIVHSHASRIGMSRGYMGLGFDGASKVLISTPLYTNMSIPALLAQVWAGGTSLIMRRFELDAFLSLAGDRGATHFFMVPTIVERILESGRFDPARLAATRVKYVAGAHLAPELKSALRTRWPGRLVEVYGMTEGAPVSVLFADENPDKLQSVGRAARGCEIRILGEHDAVLRPGGTGEIVGRSGCMMLGYNNLPRETEDLIWRDEDGRAFFRSGDIGRLDEDGFLYLLDRKKDMIISGGFNIYAADLEPIVAGHPAVSEVAVIGVPSARWGETPLALVVLRAGNDASAAEILEWCNARLSKHQRLGEVELRKVLPRNALGKVLKRELREPYWKQTGQRAGRRVS